MGGIAPLIVITGLAIGHGRKTLLSGIGLTLLPGQVICLLGPNGVGKTTLFRTILGLIPPRAGSVRLGGRLLAGMPRRDIAAHLAHVPQSLVSPLAYTALDIVLMGAAAGLGFFARPGPAETAAAMAALERMGIAELAQVDITLLSGGQRQLVLIARALAQNACAVLMDEPSASLDFVNRRMVEAAVRDLARAGIGVIFSSHDPDQAAGLADAALLLGRDGIVAQGPVAEAVSPETLSRLYRTTVHGTDRPDGRRHFY